MATITYRGTLEAVDCYRCGVRFGIPQELNQLLLAERDRRTFYCPNGHGQHYVGQSEAAKQRARANQLETQLQAREAALVATRDQLQATERSRRAYKGSITRLRRRVQAGTCPACEQSFPDLAEHMTDRHPDYAEHDGET